MIRKFLYWVLLYTLCLQPFLALAAPDKYGRHNPANEPPKLALLIHLSRYQWRESINTGNGLSLMRNALIQQGYQQQNIVELANEKATVDAVRVAFQKFIQIHLNGHSGAMVTILLDGHGSQVPDLDFDERKEDPLGQDLFDEAFDCYDAPVHIDTSPKAAKSPPKGRLLDDELGRIYKLILEAIGPQGHLVVIMPGCHTRTAMKDRSPSSRIVPLLDNLSLSANTVAPAPRGKFIYFCSVVNDSAQVQPNHQQKSSALVYGFTKALSHLTKTSTYQDLFVDAQQIIDNERTRSEQEMMYSFTRPTLVTQHYRDRLERVFGGYIHPTSFLSVLTYKAQSHTEKVANQLLSWARKQRLRQPTKGEPIASQDNPNRFIVVRGDVESALSIGKVLDVIDTTGNPISQGEVIAITDSLAVIELDKPCNRANLSVRVPAMTLWMYADRTVKGVIQDSLRNFMHLTDHPEQASLQLSFRNEGYVLCANQLPFSAKGCQLIQASSAKLTVGLLMARLRGLALYQALRVKARRNPLITIHYLPAAYQSYAFLPGQEREPKTWRRLAFKELEQPTELRKDSLVRWLPDNNQYHFDGKLVVDTLQSSLQLQIESNLRQRRYLQYLDITPDQPVTISKNQPSGYLGGQMTVLLPFANQPIEQCLIGSGHKQIIDLLGFNPPLGLEENSFIFSWSPINLRAVLSGQLPLSTELINAIDFVFFDSYYIVADRSSYKK